MTLINGIDPAIPKKNEIRPFGNGLFKTISNKDKIGISKLSGTPSALIIIPKAVNTQKERIVSQKIKMGKLQISIEMNRILSINSFLTSCFFKTSEQVI